MVPRNRSCCLHRLRSSCRSAEVPPHALCGADHTSWVCWFTENAASGRLRITTRLRRPVAQVAAIRPGRFIARCRPAGGGTMLVVPRGLAAGSALGSLLSVALPSAQAANVLALAEWAGQGLGDAGSLRRRANRDGVGPGPPPAPGDWAPARPWDRRGAHLAVQAVSPFLEAPPRPPELPRASLVRKTMENPHKGLARHPFSR